MSASRPGQSLPPGKTGYPFYRRLGGSKGRSGQVRKISPPPQGFDSRTVQPESQYRLRYPAHFEQVECNLIKYKVVYDCIMYFILFFSLYSTQGDVLLANYKVPLFRPSSESSFYEPHLQNLWVQMVRSKFRCLEINSENIRTVFVLSHQELWSHVFVNPLTPN